MRRRDQWIEWIRAVERESKTIGFSLELLSDRLRRDPSSLIERQLGQGDYAEATRNREATYLVRMFAEFENGLREAWARHAGKTRGRRWPICFRHLPHAAAYQTTA